MTFLTIAQICIEMSYNRLVYGLVVEETTPLITLHWTVKAVKKILLCSFFTGAFQKAVECFGHYKTLCVTMQGSLLTDIREKTWWD